MGQIFLKPHFELTAHSTKLKKSVVNQEVTNQAFYNKASKLHIWHVPPVGVTNVMFMNIWKPKHETTYEPWTYTTL